MANRTLLVGFGKIGKRLADALYRDHEVSVLSRHADQAVKECGLESRINPITADLTDAESLSDALNSTFDYVVYCVSPSQRDEHAYRQTYFEGLQNILTVLESLGMPRHLFFVSSTSVYHQDDSSWVDETSPTLPNRYNGQVLLEAETLADKADCGHSIVRFSGIYGGNRGNLRAQVRAGKSLLSNEVRLSNRIHEDDCVGFLNHLIRIEGEGTPLQPVYVATDSEPCDLNDVLSMIARQEKVELKTNTETPTRRTGNKKCSNQLMRDSGYKLKVPSFREGYALDAT